MTTSSDTLPGHNCRVGEGDHRQVGVRGARLRRQIGHEPGVEREHAVPADAELGGSRLAAQRARQPEVTNVVGVPGRDDLARPDAHRLQVGLAGIDAPDDVRLVGLGQLAAAIGLAADDHRLHQAATVGERGVGVEQLQRRHRHHVLPNPGLRQLTGEDVFTSLGARPFSAGDDPGCFAWQLDARLLAEAHAVGPLAQPIDAQSHRHLVEEGVGADGIGLRHVQGPEAGMVPVEQALALRRVRDLVAAVGRPRAAGRRDAFLQGGQAGDELEGRARRIDVGDGVVAQRLGRVVQVDGVVVGADAGRELVVVIGRQGDHGQDLAGLRVHDDRHALLQPGRAHAPLQRLRRDALHPRINGEHQVLAGLRLLHGADRLQRPALRIALLQLGAIGATQLAFEGRLDPGTADQVVAQVAVVLQVAKLLEVDRPDVAEHVGQQAAVNLAAARRGTGAPAPPRPPRPAAARLPRRSAAPPVG